MLSSTTSSKTSPFFACTFLFFCFPRCPAAPSRSNARRDVSGDPSLFLAPPSLLPPPAPIPQPPPFSSAQLSQRPTRESNQKSERWIDRPSSSCHSFAGFSLESLPRRRNTRLLFSFRVCGRDASAFSVSVRFLSHVAGRPTKIDFLRPIVGFVLPAGKEPLKTAHRQMTIRLHVNCWRVCRR